MKLSVISPERVVFEGDVERVVVPAFDGEVGILARHAPLVTLLGHGDVRLTGGVGDGKRFAVYGGFVQVADDVVRIVTESAAGNAGEVLRER